MAHTSARWSGVRGMSYHFISSGVTISAVEFVPCPCSEIDLLPGHHKGKMSQNPELPIGPIWGKNDATSNVGIWKVLKIATYQTLYILWINEQF